MKGKLIVLYGINNLGKTTQAIFLVKRLIALGRKAKYLKYPLYGVLPSGLRINTYLREGNPEKLDAKSAQVLYAENRRQYEPDLLKDLEAGYDIVAEDYCGTGVAWGMGAGVDKNFLIELNKDFLREDLAILLHGKRFMSGKEDNHLHETNDELTNRVEKIHLRLAIEFGWKTVDANRSQQEVAEDIWKQVCAILKLSE